MSLRPLILLLVLASFVPSAALAQPGAGRGGQGRGGTGGRGGQVTPPRGSPQPEAIPRGTGAIRGFVLAADSGTPIRRAQVRASAAGQRESRLATTDAQGRFEIKELPAGRYSLNASKGGFVPLQYGQRRPSDIGSQVDLADGQVADKLVIALPRGSVLSGRITDEFGEPVANAVVMAMRNGYAGGARRLLPAAGQNSRDTTDDLGQFRLFGLQPGEYVVSANFRGTGGEVTDPAGENSGYAPTYFPGTTNASEAQRVKLDVGQENTSVIFALVATRLVRVSGSVLDSQGALVASGNVTLVPADSRGVAVQQGAGAARIDRGSFRIPNVAPGRYALQTRTNAGPGRGQTPGQRPQEMEFGRQEITVGTEDVDNLVLVMQPGARLSGQIVTDTGDPPPFKGDQIQVAARPAQIEFNSPPANARVAENFTFQLTGLFEARLIRANAPQGWSLKQVLLSGQDVTDTPVEFAPGQNVTGLQIVMTQKSTDLSGTLSDTRGDPIADATVVVFPADEKLWTFQSRYIRAARPDQTGRYQIRGLPPYDDYLMVAVRGLEDGQAGDPEFLERVKSQAGALALKEAETKVADIKVPTARQDQ